MSLRSLLGTVAGAILVLALLVAAGLVAISTRMEQNSKRLWQAVESIRAVEEIEISLLLHSLELRSLQLIGDESHIAKMQVAEEEIRRGLRDARSFISSPSEADVLQELTQDSEKYLARAAQLRVPARESVSESVDLARVALRSSERLIEINLADARRLADETNQWDQLANLLAAIVATALLIGLGIGFWSIRRYVYQPLLSLRNALVRFHLGAASNGLPELGARELQEISREFNEMAVRLARQREVQLRFIAGVAHDLRNPLSALKLSASMVRPDRPLPSEEKLRERFSLVTRQVERIERMVEDLLDTTRIEAGRLELRLERHELGGLLRETVALHEGVSPEHELVLQLPEGPVQVRCDATRISQVLNNFLSNAIKYSPRGGRVQVELSTTADSVWVAVTDSGVGIPAAERESIFEPFRRSTTTRNAIPGVGLGLAVGRRIIEAHGGHIELQSEEGVGTTFRFRLPREP